MSEPTPVWMITPEDEATAEQAEHADRMTELGLWAARFADVLSTIYDAMRAQLPERLARDVVRDYATIMLQGGHGLVDMDGGEEGA